MADHPIFKMAFSKIYPMYVQKAEKKGRTKAEVDEAVMPYVWFYLFSVFVFVSQFALSYWALRRRV